MAYTGHCNSTWRRGTQEAGQLCLSAEVGRRKLRGGRPARIRRGAFRKWPSACPRVPERRDFDAPTSIMNAFFIFVLAATPIAAVAKHEITWWWKPHNTSVHAELAYVNQHADLITGPS